MSKPKNHLYFHRRSLIHQTDKQAAEAIIQSQHMKPGVGGLYGPGIYFANTIEACDAKALRKGVYIIADVYLGKTLSLSKDEAIKMKLNKDPNVSKNIESQGFTAICGHKQPTGREFIVFDPERVKNIKFILGERPQATLTLQIKRACLFWVTDHQSAKKIVDDQELPEYNGPFGEGYYLFDSLEDAFQHFGKKETYLCADLKVDNLGQFRQGQKLDSPGLPRRYTSFHGKKKGIEFYVVKDKDLISNIHYCGGTPWNEK